MSSRLTIGCDTGANFGMCAVRGKKIFAMVTTNFWYAYDTILKDKPEETLVVLEMSTKDIVFGGRANTYSMGRKGSAPYWQSRLLKDRLLDLGYPVLTTEPSAMGKNKPDRPMNQKIFSEDYGWYGKSNEHSRDAYFSALAYSVIWDRNPDAIWELVHASRSVQ